jgi:hypothetical protein
MQPDNHNAILSRFNAWMYVPCWMMCNGNKQPVTLHAGHYSTAPERDYQTGWRLRWKTEPQDHITTLDKVILTSEMLPGYGIGPLIGMNNPLVCYDFDHCLDVNGDIINEKVRAFISVIKSYTEVSVSGSGLHVFATMGQPEAEYGFNPKWIGYGGGKFYGNRFIRLTGNEYREHQYPVKAFTHKEYGEHRLFLEHQEQAAPANIPRPGTYTGVKQGWDRILDAAGIIHREATNYAGTTRAYSDGTSRTVERAYRILCPNYRQHSNHENRNKAVVSGGGDVAILVKFKDGQTAVKCGHNHCDGVNLLQMLWDQIKQNRAEEKTRLLNDMRVEP